VRGLGTCESLLAKGLDWRGREGAEEGEGASGLSFSFLSGGTYSGKPLCVLCFANPRVNSLRFKLLCFGLVGASFSRGSDLVSESLLRSNLRPSLGGALVSLGTLGGSFSGGIANFESGGSSLLAGLGVDDSEGGSGDSGVLSNSEVAKKLGKGGLELSSLIERRRLEGESGLKSGVGEFWCWVVGLPPKLFEVKGVALFEVNGVGLLRGNGVGVVEGSVAIFDANGVAVLLVRVLGLLVEEEESGEDATGGEGRDDRVSFEGRSAGVSRGFSVGIFTIIATGGLVNARRLLKGEEVVGRKEV
jgi:hypothetical protein